MTSAAIPAFLELRVETDARLREVVRAHYDPLWRFLRRMGTPEGHVEDAAQQVLLVFARRAHEVEKEAERPFLFGTALRVAADFRRKGQRGLEIADAEAILRHPDPGPDAEDQLGQKERRRFLDAILDELPPENRAVFVLAELEEITMAEIARLLEIPPGTVASRLRRARELVEAGALELRSRGEREEGRGDEEA
jgi:RNA polymerase sigma-70 factor (ECF subfamily)